MLITFTEEEPRDRILAIKRTLGKELLILTHHYQRKEIVDLGDFKGDSFELSRKAAADANARFIVFCGVHFMAESAAILAQPDQTVQIPDTEAGCWMADMAGPETVETAWKEICSIVSEGSILPIAYMNSDAALKAFCGARGGAVCTSSNARSILEWGFSKREKIFFFPDQHLGRNVGNQMALKPKEMIVWHRDKPLGGNTADDIHKARLILWHGYCLVHTRFQVEHVLKMRSEFPNAKVVVHPECTQEVLALADACGSTSFIVNYVNNAPPGSTIIIGTEINLVHRLALENPDKRVLDLHRSLCPNMFKISLNKLLWTVENVARVNVVSVPESLRANARIALDRMLNPDRETLPVLP